MSSHRGPDCTNVKRAGVDKIIRCEAASISDLAPPEADFGWLLTNPPYGGRIQGGDLRNLYARFGDVLRDKLPGWRIGMLSPDRRLTGHTRVKWKPGFATKNGGISVTFVTTRVPSR